MDRFLSEELVMSSLDMLRATMESELLSGIYRTTVRVWVQTNLTFGRKQASEKP